jgi:hypothetical protein
MTTQINGALPDRQLWQPGKGAANQPMTSLAAYRSLTDELLPRV